MNRGCVPIHRRCMAISAMVLLIGASRPVQAQPSVIIDWLDCVECTPAQLASVSTQRDAVVPALRDILLRGASDHSLAAERQRLSRAYKAMKDYEQRHPQNRVTGTEQDYINRYLPAFELRNRLRAARALGAIGTPTARQALQEAQALPSLPKPLAREIANALLPNP